MAMYGLRNSQGGISSTADDFGMNSLTFQLLVKGYEKLSGNELKSAIKTRNSLVEKIQRNIGLERR